MQPNLAQVLNTLAHEIRTPLAVSQGYLKLYLDGRLTNADDQKRAFQQTREALGMLATLCTEMTKVSALSEHPSPAPSAKLPAADFIERLKAAGDIDGASWSGAIDGKGVIATHSAGDLVLASAIVARAAFDEARDEPRVIRASDDGLLTVLAGSPAGVEALAEGPDGGAAREMDFTRGGKGLKLIWAAFVLQQHRVRTWAHQGHRGAAGLQFPLVHA
jgi:hypothetical protein